MNFIHATNEVHQSRCFGYCRILRAVGSIRLTLSLIVAFLVLFLAAAALSAGGAKR